MDCILSDVGLANAKVTREDNDWVERPFEDSARKLFHLRLAMVPSDAFVWQMF